MNGCVIRCEREDCIHQIRGVVAKAGVWGPGINTAADALHHRLRSGFSPAQFEEVREHS